MSIKNNPESLAAVHDALQWVELSDNPAIKLFWDITKTCFPILATVGEKIVDSKLLDIYKNKVNILLKSIIEGTENITLEQLKKVDGFEGFILALEAVKKLGQDKKIIMVGLLYKNTFINNQPVNFNEYEEWINAITEMSHREIIILLHLYDFEKRYDLKNIEDRSSSNLRKNYEKVNEYWDSFMEKIQTICALEDEYIYGILQRITRTGFYTNSWLGAGTDIAACRMGYTTVYFRKFADKIQNSNSLVS